MSNRKYPALFQRIHEYMAQGLTGNYLERETLNNYRRMCKCISDGLYDEQSAIEQYPLTYGVTYFP